MATAVAADAEQSSARKDGYVQSRKKAGSTSEGRRSRSLSITERLWGTGKPLACLENGPFAMYLDDKELLALAKIFRRKKLNAGDILVKQGEEAEDFFIIEAGELSVVIELAGVSAVFLSKKLAGEFIGERVLMLDPDESYTRSASVVAIDKCKVLACSRKDLSKFLKKHPKVAEVMTDVVMVKAKTLKNLSLLKGAEISEEQLDRLGTLFRYSIAAPNQVLFLEGESGSEMFVVSQGKIEISVRSKKEENLGEKMIVGTFGPGQYFGEFALAMNMPRSATAVSLEKTLLLTLEASDLMRFLSVSPDLQKAFDKQVAERITHHLRRFEMPFLSGFSDEQYNRLAETCRIANVPGGMDICREGEDGTTFYMIVNGEVVVSVKGKQVATMGPGRFFGEIALVQNTKRTATVTTTIASVLLACEKDDFDKVFAQMPWVVADFQAHLAPEDMTLDHIINHTRALKYFTQQLEKEFSTENLQFVQAVQEFKTIADGDPNQLTTARAMFTKYLEPGAEIEVNVPFTLWKEALEKVEDAEAGKDVWINSTLFNDCLEHILHLLSTDSLQRFKKGPLFREFVDSLHKYAVDDNIRMAGRLQGTIQAQGTV